MRAALMMLVGLLAVFTPAIAGWNSKSEAQLVKEADKFVQGKPEPLQKFLHTLYMEGEWNAVLNLDLLSLAALEVGNVALSEKALDQATSRIERIYANDPNAERARSLWSAESVKDFKGEPYERAMTFLYRGLLYVGRGDYQNARASFLQAEFQNTIGLKEKYVSTFTFATFLAAWASHCEGDNGRAQQILHAALPAAVDDYFKQSTDKIPNYLSVAELGVGPEKVTLGDAHAILGFLPQPDVTGTVRLVFAPAQSTPSIEGTAANVDWLALTRGGRAIQGVLDGKVAFKANTAAISDAAGAASSAAFYSAVNSLSGDKSNIARSLGFVGAAGGVVSAIAGGFSRATNTEADTRYWGSLPKRITIDSFEQIPDPLDVSLTTSSTRTARKPVLRHRGAGCALDWTREFSALDHGHGGTGNPSEWPAEPLEDNRDVANAIFRAMLVKEF